MTNAEQLAKAIHLASKYHCGDVDKGGYPYILHPLRVMSKLQFKYPDDFELMAIAVMHDLCEDCDISISDMRGSFGFSERICVALDLLTHKRGVSYKDYIIQISENKDATIVKIEDLNDNSQINRLKGLRQRDFDRIAKYHTCYAFLTGRISKKDFIKSTDV